MSENKKTYRKLYPEDTPIFHQPFFLDAVAGEHWDVALVMRDSVLQASLPYYIKKVKGYVNISQPEMTQFLGPWFNIAERKNNKGAKEKKLIEALFEQLPAFSSYLQNWHYRIDNWLPLYWKGYTQTTRYTYVIDDISDTQKIFDGFDADVKRQIKNAEKKLTLQSTDDFDAFFSVLEKSFSDRKKEGLPDKKIFRALNEACTKHSCRKIILAEDAEGIKGVIYLIWDKNSVYYLAGGKDPAFKNEGAMQLLIWEGIQLAASLKLTFDFEGSMIEPIERFFRSFGPEQKGYFAISKINSRKIRIIDGIKTIRKAISKK